MARPSNAKLSVLTPVNQIAFQWNLDSMRSRNARDAGLETLEAIISWANVNAWLTEAVGYSTWGPGKAVTFNRVLPLEHPLRPGFWIDDVEMTDYGAYETRSDFNDPLNNNAPAQDWVIYTCTFTRPKWYVLTDKQLATSSGTFPAPEIGRFTWESDMPRPQSRIVSGFGLEYDTSAGGTGAGPWNVVPDERQAIPDYQIDIVVTWVQIPIGAVPYDAILNRLNTTNMDNIQFVPGGRVWRPGELLFRGLAKPLEQYVGADDNLYFDLVYRFTQQPGGWNSYLRRNPVGGAISYAPVRVRTVPPAVGIGVQPYPLSFFYKLFVPNIDLGALP